MQYEEVRVGDHVWSFVFGRGWVGAVVVRVGAERVLVRYVGSVVGGWVHASLLERRVNDVVPADMGEGTYFELCRLIRESVKSVLVWE